jgi:hypothetical protein
MTPRNASSGALLKEQRDLCYQGLSCSALFVIA